MNENSDEKDGIEVRDDGCPTNDHAPTEGHDPVGDIVLVGCQKYAPARQSATEDIQVCGNTSTSR